MSLLEVVDLSSEEAVAAAALYSACVSRGFFYLSNHGISAALVAAAFQHSQAFFACREGAKMTCIANVNSRSGIGRHRAFME